MHSILAQLVLRFRGRERGQFGGRGTLKSCLTCVLRGPWNLMKSRRRMRFYLMTLFDTTRRLLRMAPNSESCTARITALCCASMTSDMNCRQSFSDGAFLEQFARICFWQILRSTFRGRVTPPWLRYFRWSCTRLLCFSAAVRRVWRRHLDK